MNTFSVFKIFLMGLAFASSDALHGLVDGGEYKIISSVNHFVLDVKNAIVGNASPVIAFPWRSTNNQNQLWIAKKITNSPATFSFATKLNENFVLDCHRDSLSIYARGYGTNDQEWFLQPMNEGSSIFFINCHQHHDRVLELDADGVNVRLKRKDSNNRNQRWIIAENL